jgi:hypothetical protein
MRGGPSSFPAGTPGLRVPGPRVRPPPPPKAPVRGGSNSLRPLKDYRTSPGRNGGRAGVVRIPSNPWKILEPVRGETAAGPGWFEFPPTLGSFSNHLRERRGPGRGVVRVFFDSWKILEPVRIGHSLRPQVPATPSDLRFRPQPPTSGSGHSLRPQPPATASDLWFRAQPPGTASDLRFRAQPPGLASGSRLRQRLPLS